MTSSSNLILQHYIKLTEFLGKALGPDYEVALHDLTRKDRSIIAIANNYISGRELERMGVTPGHLTHSERLQVITSLESAGIFLLKGAIKSAAAALGCSTASIYRYLSQINPSD